MTTKRKAKKPRSKLDVYASITLNDRLKIGPEIIAERWHAPESGVPISFYRSEIDKLDWFDLLYFAPGIDADNDVRTDIVFAELDKIALAFKAEQATDQYPAYVHFST